MAKVIASHFQQPSPVVGVVVVVVEVVRGGVVVVVATTYLALSTSSAGAPGTLKFSVREAKSAFRSEKSGTWARTTAIADKVLKSFILNRQFG